MLGNKRSLCVLLVASASCSFASAGDAVSGSLLRGSVAAGRRREPALLRGFNFFEPDPELLRWDFVNNELFPNSTSGLSVRHGWMRVPLLHDEQLEDGEDMPQVCLRVRGLSSYKRASRNETAKQGVVLTHCGGPGSGRECMYGVHLELLDEYDYITIDQRGVPASRSDVKSEPLPPPECPFVDALVYPTIKCNELMNRIGLDGLAVALDLNKSSVLFQEVVRPILLAGGMPDSLTTGLKERNETFVRWYYRLAQMEYNLCYTNPKYELKKLKSGRVLNAFNYKGTVHLAHDLDHLRRALGQENLSCWGASYGTSVCGTFATIFPDRVNRLILDGNAMPDPDVVSVADAAAWGSMAAFRGLSAACEQTRFRFLPEEDECRLGAFMATKVNDMVNSEDPAVAFLADSYFNVFGYAPEVPCSACMMSCMAAIDDDQLPEGCPGVLPLFWPLEDNASDADMDRFSASEIFSVVGLDTAGRLTEEGLIRWWRQAKDEYTVGLKRALLYAVFVSVWPALPRPMPSTGSTDVSPLIVGNLHDLQTSYKESQLMRENFPRASLMTYQGYGHGMYELVEQDFVEGNATDTYDNHDARSMCTQTMVKYMETGELPNDGTTCSIATVPEVSEKSAKRQAKETQCYDGLWSPSSLASLRKVI